MAVFSQPHYPPFGALAVMDTTVVFSSELRQKFEIALRILVGQIENYQKQTGHAIPTEIKDFLDIYTAEENLFFEKPERFVTVKFFLDREINLRLILLSKNILEEIKSLHGTKEEVTLNEAEVNRLVDKYGLDQLSFYPLSTLPLIRLLILSYKGQQPAKIKLGDLRDNLTSYSEYKDYLADIDPKGGDFRKYSLFVEELVKVVLEFYKALGFTYHEMGSQMLDENNFKIQATQKFRGNTGDDIYKNRLNKLSSKDMYLLKEKVESEFEKELISIQSGGQTLNKNLSQEVVERVVKAYFEKLRQTEEVVAIENTRRELQQILKKSPSSAHN